MKLMTSSKKVSVSLTYVSIVVQALSTMLLTSFYLRTLGAETYGLYQMINAVAQYIMILDLGISTVMIRYIAEFDAKGNHEKSENFAFHFGLIVLLAAILIAVIGAVVNGNIENIYRNLTLEEYELSHRLFNFIIFQLVFTVFGHFFQGVSYAYDQYTFERTVSIVQIVVNTILVILFIKLGMGLIGIVLANGIVIFLHTAISAIYAFFAVHFRIRFHGWEFSMLQPAMLLMLAMLLQAIVGHVNSSVDKTILGIMTTKTDVTIYAVAATIITMFNTLPMAVSTVYQSDAVRMVSSGADREKMTSFVIKPGRLQFMMVGAFLAGFFLFGQDFLVCWTNEKMLPAWKYVLIIMIPNSVPLIQNTCLSILNALDKRMFRSLILVAITGFNIGLTVLLISLIGPIGAPLATGISYLIGHVILMNLYYGKKIGLNVWRMFKEIFRRTWLCILIALILNAPLMLWRVDGNWLVLLLKAVVFCLTYGVLLLFIGMNSSEKSLFFSLMRKLRIGQPKKHRG